MAFALQKAQMHDDRVHGSRKVKVTILASEWGPSNGGLSTLNRELAIQLAKFPEVEITFFLPKCSQEDRKIALEHKVKIVEATSLSGFEQLDWLCFPPDDLEIDIIIGHGVKLGKQAQVIKDRKTCKWFQVVHTDLEELGMFSNPISKGEEKHKTEVELCEMADHVVGVGPKLSDAFRSYLRGCKKDDHVLDFTPGVLEEFEAVNQDPSERQQRSVLVFGRGDVDDFELKGFDIAGKAIAALQDTRLMFVGAPDGKHEEIAKRLIECGVPASRLRVRGFVQDRESLKRLFQEVDLVVMPSRTEGFGVTGLEAMSAGLPVLVSRNSGFGEALRSVAFGSSFVIDSEEPAEWTVAIQNIWSKDRKCRLEEAVTLRDCYGRKYNWTKQIKELVDRMVSLTHEDSLNAWSSLETKCNPSQRMEGLTEDHEGTSSEESGIPFERHIPSKIASHEGASSLRKEPVKSLSIQSVPGSSASAGPSMEIENNQKRNSYDDEQLVSETSLSSDCEMKADAASGNPTKISTNTDSQSQNSHSLLTTTFIEVIVSSNAQDLTVEQQRTITKELEQMACRYRRHQDLSSLPFVGRVARLAKFIEKVFEVVVLFVQPGSLVITVQCPSLESLESLWKGYCSGYLNDTVECFLVTDELKRNLGLDNVWLKTTIEEENYLICKKAFMDNSEPSMEIENNQRTNSYDDEQLISLISEASLSSDCEVKADTASGNPTKISTNTDSQSQNSRKRKMSEYSCDPDSVLTTAFIEVVVSSNAQDLTVEQQRTIAKELEQLANRYRRHQDLSSLPFFSRVARLAEFIEKAFEVVVLFVQPGSLIITVQCPSLESLESLWKGYCSGYLNDVVESFLVTDELKRKLGLDNVRLKTTIQEENYSICKKAFVENSGVASITKPSSQTVHSGQAEDTRWSEVSTDVEKGSRFPLRRAAVSGQHETVKELLESGEDVVQSDEIVLLPSPERRRSLGARYSMADSGSESTSESEEESWMSWTPVRRIRRFRVHHSSTVSESVRKREEKKGIVRSQRAERRRSFRARYSLADADSGSESMSEMEDESKIVRSPRAERRRSFSGRYSLPDADSGSVSMSEMEDEGKDKKQVLIHMERAEKAKASRGLLHKAAINGQFEAIKVLLESGEDVDKKDQFSLTPLHLACWYGQESVVKLFLGHGANVNAKDRELQLMISSVLSSQRSPW